jgi:tetratricopeptide (TPR) repeat protein
MITFTKYFISIKTIIPKIPQLIEKTRSVLVGFVIIYIIIMAGFSVFKEMCEEQLVIDAFSVFPDLEGTGYSGEVIAKQIMDHYFEIYNKAATLKGIKNIQPKWQQKDIVIDMPISGITMAEVVRIIKEIIGSKNVRISGEVVMDGSLKKLTLRIKDGCITVQDSSMSTLLEKASEKIILATDPYVMAAYSFSKHDMANSKYIIDSVLSNSLVNKKNKESIPWYYMLKGHIYERKNEFDSALIQFNEALKIDPDFPLAFYNIGTILGQDLQQYQKAIDNFEKSIKMGYWDAYFNSANCYYLIGKCLCEQYLAMNNNTASGDLTKIQFNFNRSIDYYDAYVKKKNLTNTKEHFQMCFYKIWIYNDLADILQGKEVDICEKILQVNKEVNSIREYSKLTNTKRMYDSLVVNILCKISKTIAGDTLSRDSDINTALDYAKKTIEINKI